MSRALPTRTAALATVATIAVSLGLAGCSSSGTEGLTDAPLTDTEVSAFLAAASNANASATARGLDSAVSEAAAQRRAVKSAYSKQEAHTQLLAARARVLRQQKALDARADAIRGTASASDLAAMATSRAALLKALKSASLPDLLKAEKSYDAAVTAGEQGVAARAAAAAATKAAQQSQQRTTTGQGYTTGTTTGQGYTTGTTTGQGYGTGTTTNGTGTTTNGTGTTTNGTGTTTGH